MAKKIIERLEDDLDGTPADETVTFALDGTAYEIDLNEANAAKLREAFDIYVKAARRVQARATGRARTRAAARASGGRNSEIREWAKNNGFEVNDRGRIPANVREAFERAHA